MAVTQYIGARYVPLFAEPTEWSSDRTYEPLTIVQNKGNSYTSKQAVPVGIDITDEEFWVVTGNYNAQVEQYRTDTKRAGEDAKAAREQSEKNATDIAAIGTAVEGNTAAIATNATAITDEAKARVALGEELQAEVTARKSADQQRYTKDEADELFMLINNGITANVTDYGADPTGATYSDTAIQKALDSDATLIQFPKGTYRLNRPLRIPSNTTLMGYGAHITTNDTSVINTSTSDTEAKLLVTNKADGVTGGYGANSHINIVGLEFSNPSHVCTLLGFSHADHVLVRDCTFHDITEWHMIEFNACQHCTVENSSFYNYGSGTSKASEMIQIDGAFGSGMFPWFGPYDGTVCNDILVHDCVFDNGSIASSWGANTPCAVGNHTRPTSDANPAHTNIRIHNNHAKGLGGFVKFINASRVEIADNVVDHCGSGVFAQGGAYFFNIHDNYLNGEGWSSTGNMGNRGIALIGETYSSKNINPYMTMVTDNFVIGFQDHGITVQGQFSHVTGNVVTGCQGYGIYTAYAETHGYYADNQVWGNGSKYDTPYDLYIRAYSNTGITSQGDIVYTGNKASRATCTGTIAANNAITVTGNIFKTSYVANASGPYSKGWGNVVGTTVQ